MCTARRSIRLGGGPPGTPPRSKHRPLWTEFLTHAYENIILPQTSFVGGKYSLVMAHSFS